MINPHARVALARERQKTFLAEAEAHRRAKQAQSHRQRVSTLIAPGSPLRWIPSWLRPDRNPRPGHRPAELRYLTDAGHHDHEALGAPNHADGRGEGTAATSGTPKTRRLPTSPSPSSTTGTAGDWAPSCRPG